MMGLKKMKKMSIKLKVMTNKELVFDDHEVNQPDVTQEEDTEDTATDHVAEDSEDKCR